MNFEADDLLAMVDEWKLSIHEKLSKMSASQRRKFWRLGGDKASSLGLSVVAKLPSSTSARRSVGKKRRSQAS